MFKAYAAHSPSRELIPYAYPAPPLTPSDIEVKIECCGLCYSDVHLINNDWHNSTYPLIPGHEIIGTVTQKGSQVNCLQLGDRVGIGWQCGACLICDSCLRHHETACALKIRTCVDRPGGFADKIVVDHRFAYSIPESLASAWAAPLLCAGITVYSPLRIHAIQAHQSVAILGIGGLGHLALQFAKAFGYKTTAISTSADKEQEALQFGADHFVLLPEIKSGSTVRFDFILSTVHADLDWSLLIQLLKPQGKLCLVGIPPAELKIPARLLVSGDKIICGSGTGSRHHTQEMLQYAAQHNIRAQIETFPMSAINEAILRLKNKQARYRIVLYNTG